MRPWGWLLGGAAAAGLAAVLWPREAHAAPKGWTNDEDYLAVALARLKGFIAAARIDAVASTRTHGTGYALQVAPGKAFVAEDAAALPRRVDGLDVAISGWPR